MQAWYSDLSGLKVTIKVSDLEPRHQVGLLRDLLRSLGMSEDLNNLPGFSEVWDKHVKEIFK